LLISNIIAQDAASFVVDMSNSSSFDHFWEGCVGSGHAALALRDDWRRQLKHAHDKLGMQRVRFHGIFDDDLSAYQNESGVAVYSWYNQDQIYDFLLSIGMQPYVELSFMPDDMASGDETIFHYKGNITPPKRMSDWYDMLVNFAQHLIERYGIEEIRSWYFETWNEPNCGFFNGTQQQYFDLLNATVSALKSVDSELQVGGPATCQSAWIPETLQYVSNNSVPIDFISTHQYPTDVVPLTRDALKIAMSKSREAVGPDMTLIYSETNDGLFEYQLHDTIYASAFAVFNMIDLQGIADIVSWWSFSDIFEEGGFNSAPFSRNYGLQALYDIEKPAFKAFELLHEAGDVQYEVKGSHPTAGLIVTQNDEGYQILMYNHNIPNASIEIVDMTVTLQGMDAGAQYNTTIRRIDEENCNPIAVWFELDMPMYPTQDQIELMQEASRFNAQPIEYTLSNDGDMTFNVILPIQGVAAIKVIQL